MSKPEDKIVLNNGGIIAKKYERIAATLAAKERSEARQQVLDDCVRGGQKLSEDPEKSELLRQIYRKP